VRRSDNATNVASVPGGVRSSTSSSVLGHVRSRGPVPVAYSHGLQEPTLVRTMTACLMKRPESAPAGLVQNRALATFHAAPDRSRHRSRSREKCDCE